MKFTIEHELLNATTDNLHVAQSLLDILKQSTKFEEITTTKKDFGIKIDDVEEPTTDDIPADKYLTITENNIKCGGKFTKTYNGAEIWCIDDAIQYFKESIPLFKEESGLDVTELHVLQSSTEGKYAQPGNPVADPNGKCCWCRIKTKDGKLSRWVFLYASGSVDDCRSSCANYCGAYVQGDSGFRGSVFGSVGN